ncbi:nicotinic acid mononucleotide adenyltransferase [Galbibacter sp.]|uniref:toxin-antitoxin system YwqK family antitoxin n=1 Tax=Galbibacter sp. TaxID=2918471 RepID=UPI002B5B50F0|nr:nicotinic acid mononucleotide adenyltransferase [Galbibacter sp.]HLV63990.1 hypothetical protein [Galbibacter sp.]
MRNILTTLALVFSVMLFGQQVEKKPKLEIENGMVKATYYHDNGVVAQTGTYVDGKLHGQWKSFDEQGKAIAIANYDMGAKTGNWFFYHGDVLKEVTYENSAIASVRSWNQTNKIVVNP